MIETQDKWLDAQRRASAIMSDYRKRYSNALDFRQQGAPPQPGMLFGVPGFTQPTEQKDTNDGITFTLQQSSQVAATAAGMQNFKQTDVVTWWEIDFSLTQTVVVGGGGVTSPYFPYNYIQKTELSVQNMYKPVQVLNGVDLAIFQLLRPMRQQYALGGQNGLETSPFGTYITAALPQANLVSQTAAVSTTGSINFSLDLPTSLYFDLYYHLDKNGNPVPGVPQPQRAIVSPLWMSGSARYVIPDITFAAATSTQLDNTPFTFGTSPSFSGSMKLNVRRVGFYGSNDPRVLPPVMNPWQLRRSTVQYSIAGRSVVDIPVQAVAQPGQHLLLFVRMWDPAAGSGNGAPININTVTKFQLLYGSGLIRFDDTPLTAQKRILRQHNILLPVGVLAWDLAVDKYGRVTNMEALNTLTTAGVVIHIEFTGAQSASAYVAVGSESLVVVE